MQKIIIELDYFQLLKTLIAFDLAARWFLWSELNLICPSNASYVKYNESWKDFQ